MKRLRSSIVILVGTVYFLVGVLIAFVGVTLLLPFSPAEPYSQDLITIRSSVDGYGLAILLVGLVGVSIGAFMIITIFRQAK